MDTAPESKSPSGDRIATRVRVPLSVKIGLWLGLNFLFVVAIAVGVLLGRGGLQGWIGEPIGDRLQLVGVAINSAIRNGEEVETMLARYDAAYDLSFAFYSNEGVREGGSAIPIPLKVNHILKNDVPGDGLGAPPRQGPDDSGPPRPRERPDD